MKKILLVAAVASALAACTNEMGSIGPVGDVTQLAPATLEITQQNAGALINVHNTTKSQSDKNNPVARATTNCFYGGDLTVTGSETANGSSSKVVFTNCNQDGEWALLGRFDTVVSASGNESAGTINLQMTGDLSAVHVSEPIDTKLKNYSLRTNIQSSGSTIESTTTVAASIDYNSPDVSGSVNMYTKPMIAVDIVDGQERVSGSFYFEGAKGSYISIDAKTGEVTVNGEVFQQ